MKLLLEGGRVYAPGGFHQQFKLVGFCAEGKGVNYAQPCQKLHAASGKVLGAAAGEGEGQFQYQVAAALHCQLCPLPFVQQGRLSPLGEAAADDGDYSCIGAALSYFI